MKASRAAPRFAACGEHDQIGGPTQVTTVRLPGLGRLEASGYLTGSYLYFCPAIVAAYIRPPLAIVKTATPSW
jgi:hypothetical protein